VTIFRLLPLLKKKWVYENTLLPVCICPPPSAVVRQRLSKQVSAATNTYVKTELLDAVFSMRSVSYQILNM
jgi:hypothetical protein